MHAQVNLEETTVFKMYIQTSEELNIQVINNPYLLLKCWVAVQWRCVATQNDSLSEDKFFNKNIFSPFLTIHSFMEKNALVWSEISSDQGKKKAENLK